MLKITSALLDLVQHFSVPWAMRVKVISILEDNYMYLIIDEQSKEALAVDPAVPHRVREQFCMKQVYVSLLPVSAMWCVSLTAAWDCEKRRSETHSSVNHSPSLVGDMLLTALCGPEPKHPAAECVCPLVFSGVLCVAHCVGTMHEAMRLCWRTSLIYKCMEEMTASQHWPTKLQMARSSRYLWKWES